MSCPVHPKVQQGGHLLRHDACRGASAEQHVDGARVCHARENRTFMDVDSIDSHHNVTGNVGKASFCWGWTIVYNFIVISFITFLYYVIFGI